MHCLEYNLQVCTGKEHMCSTRVVLFWKQAHLRACFGYSLCRTKAKTAESARERVPARCEAAGVRFHAVVLEATGGVEDREAAPVLHQIAEAVAAVEDAEVATVKAELYERLSLELVRSAARAVLRRAPKTALGGEGAALAYLRREARLAGPEEAAAAAE